MTASEEAGEREWGPEERPKRVSAAAFRRYDDRTVVVLPLGAEINVLNEIAARIFELLDGANTVAEIVDAVCQEYQVEPETARQDVQSFLGELESHRMLA